MTSAEPFAFSEHEHMVMNAQGQCMPGILLQSTLPFAIASRSVIVLQHGFLSDRNAFFFQGLAHELGSCGYDTFRYDIPLVSIPVVAGQKPRFRYADFDQDILDLQTVIDYLSCKCHLKVTGIIGHSRGGTMSLLYAGASQPMHLIEGRALVPLTTLYSTLRFLINISGRFHLKEGPIRHFRRCPDELALALKDPDYHFPWTVMTRGNQETFNIYGHMVRDFMIEWPAMYCRQIPSTIACFTIHGSKDSVVPVTDATCFDREIPNHRMTIIPEADHCFTEHATQLFDSIKTILGDIFSVMSHGPEN